MESGCGWNLAISLQSMSGALVALSDRANAQNWRDTAAFPLRAYMAELATTAVFAWKADLPSAFCVNMNATCGSS